MHRESSERCARSATAVLCCAVLCCVRVPAHCKVQSSGAECSERRAYGASAWNARPLAAMCRLYQPMSCTKRSTHARSSSASRTPNTKPHTELAAARTSAECASSGSARPSCVAHSASSARTRCSSSSCRISTAARRPSPSRRRVLIAKRRWNAHFGPSDRIRPARAHNPNRVECYAIAIALTHGHLNGPTHPDPTGRRVRRATRLRGAEATGRSHESSRVECISKRLPKSSCQWQPLLSANALVFARLFYYCCCC